MKQLLLALLTAYSLHGEGGIKLIDREPPEDLPQDVTSGVATDIELPDVEAMQNELVSIKSQLVQANQKIADLETALKTANETITLKSTEISELNDRINELETAKVGSPFKGWVYSYDEKNVLGWSFVHPLIAPYMLNEKLGWVKYDLGTNPRNFYLYRDNQWIEIE